MTRTTWVFVFLAAAVLALGLGGTAYAFHSGGVAECVGCHSMHSPAAGGTFLLVGTDASSTCLTCHQNAADTGPSSYHVSTAPGSLGAGQAPLQRTPGGDFGWLKKTYTFTVRGTTTTEDGATHGHNIVANDFGYVVDPHNATAPGGTFPASQLACNSCHDQHGQWRRLSDNSIVKGGQVGVATAPIIGSGSYNNSAVPAAGQAVGVYRLLAGGAHGTANFPGVPAAKVPSTYNRTEASTQTRTAYGHATTGGHTPWGEWCSSCHGNMHSNGNYVHPVDETLGSTIAGLYGAYVKSGDMSGVAGSSFTSLVPFIENTSDYTVLASHAQNNDSQLAGPASNDRVSCLTCHRAHATGWEYGLRWNMEGEFMVYNSLYPGTDTTPTVPQFARGRTGAETQAAYYDRPVTQFASYQRVLCNKCHAKD
ncbi:MAG: cytochrome C [Candidatus Rokubacteria bacterium]|nr:cytochrome C [Candidatus Rokubacteria bacterium]